MKILYVSHTSLLQSFYRKRIDYIANLTNYKIKVLIPKYWKELWKGDQKVFPEDNKSSNYELIKSKIFFAGNGHTAFFRNHVLALIKKFKPDIIDIEKEPWSFGIFQVILLKKLFSPKSKVIFHTSQNIYKKYPFPFNLIQKYTFKYADYAFARNEEAKKILIRNGFEKSIEIVTHGVDTNVFLPKQVYELKNRLGINNEFIIGYIGTITKQKGIETLLDAVRKLNFTCKLLIIGDGPHKKNIINYAKERKVDNVKFIDAIEHQEVPDYLNCMDVFVLPSITLDNLKEKFGRVLIESMACEIATVGSSSGEIPNVIGDGGFIFEEKNSQDLADIIEKLYYDKRLREHISKKGRVRVLQLYSWESIAKKTIKVYNELLQSK